MNIKTSTLFLLLPTGIIFFWIGAYINHTLDGNNMWWDFPAWMTIFLTVILGIVISVWAMLSLIDRFKKVKEEK